MKSTTRESKGVYHSPEIVDVGDIVEITASGGSPLRDNNNDELRTFEKGAGGVLPSLHGDDEVDLGGR